MLGGEPGNGDDEGEEDDKVNWHSAEDAVGNGEELYRGVEQEVGEHRGHGVHHADEDQTSPGTEQGDNNQPTLMHLS